MTKFCKQGHEQTPNNQYKVNDKQRGVRYRCKPCALVAKRAFTLRNRKGVQDVIEAQAERRGNRIEDIEFLVGHGAEGAELLARSGYTTMPILRAALRKAGHEDLRAKTFERE